MDKQETEPTIEFTDLAKFGFKSETSYLHCRVCGELITKVIGASLLGTNVKYGICRKRSHGVSIMKVNQ